MYKKGFRYIKTNADKSAGIFFVLCKILIPVLVLLKLMEPLGVVDFVSTGLEGVMQSVGLPGYTAIVLVSGMLGNLYTGLSVLAALWSNDPLTVAQAGVLSLMMLVAHTLPVEVAVAHKAAAHWFFNIVWRVGCAYLMAWLAHVFMDALDLGKEPAVLLLQPAPLNLGWIDWAGVQAQSLGYIFFIIFLLVSFMDGLQKMGIEKKLHRLITPLLKPFSLSGQSVNITIIGMLLGIAYGGAFLIREVKDGKIDRRESSIVMTMLGLNHGIIEDPALMALTGASLWILLPFRFLLGMALTILFVLLWRLFPSMERWVVAKNTDGRIRSGQ